jgi:histidine triad (HIT) family protein
MKYDKQNIFAKIIRGEIPAKKVYEDEGILAFYDISPAAPIHCVVIPKGEYVDYSDFVKNSTTEEIKHYFTKINDIAVLLGLGEDGFRLCVNRGAKSGQSVFHFHTHILGGTKLPGHV